MINHEKPSYGTLEEIRLRKEQLSDAMVQDGEKIAAMWGQLFLKRNDSTKGEYIAGIIANSVTAIDAFLMVRKLMKNYQGVLNFFGLGKSVPAKKKNKRK